MKATTIKQYMNEQERPVVEVHCDICGYCPCGHIEMVDDGIKIKSFQSLGLKEQKIETEILSH